MMYCGAYMEKVGGYFNHSFYSIAYITEQGTEYVCPNCLASPDLALQLLANAGE